MANSLMAKANSLEVLAKTMGAGSLKALIKARKKNAMVMLDTSGSMADGLNGGHSFNGGPTKISELRKTVEHLKSINPDVPMGSFAGRGARMIGEGGIPEPGGNTPMAEAISFAKNIGAEHLVLVSDGEANNEWAAMEAARSFGGPIDTFFIGPDFSRGAEFLKEIARATGGNSNVTDLSEPKLLANKIAGLLGDGSAPASSVIAL